MKIIFFGTSDFAVPSLEKIIESRHELAAVVTQPDRKKGRSLAVAPPPVKVALENKGIPLYQPQDASSADVIRELKRYEADLFVVVSFGRILKKELLSLPKLFCVNLHGSLLPEYRGAAPVNYAVMEGRKTTGVTAIRMNDKMDDGDIILKKEVQILDTDTSGSMNAKLSEIGSSLLLETINLIEDKKAEFTKQDAAKATYAYKLKKEDGLIRWSMPARDIHNRVRGLIPWPTAYAYRQGKLLKIWKSSFNEGLSDKDSIGKVIRLDENGIVVGTGKGELIIEELQLEGKKRMAAAEFLRGHRLTIGERLR